MEFCARMVKNSEAKVTEPSHVLLSDLVRGSRKKQFIMEAAERPGNI
jgi:hypothetical protein